MKEIARCIKREAVHDLGDWLVQSGENPDALDIISIWQLITNGEHPIIGGDEPIYMPQELFEKVRFIA